MSLRKALTPLPPPGSLSHAPQGPAPPLAVGSSHRWKGSTMHLPGPERRVATCPAIACRCGCSCGIDGWDGRRGWTDLGQTTSSMRTRMKSAASPPPRRRRAAVRPTGSSRALRRSARRDGDVRCRPRRRWKCLWSGAAGEHRRVLHSSPRPLRLQLDESVRRVAIRAHRISDEAASARRSNSTGTVASRRFLGKAPGRRKVRHRPRVASGGRKRKGRPEFPGALSFMRSLVGSTRRS